MKIYKISVQLEGITPIMFDRYAGNNTADLRPEDKMYFAKDGKSLILPALNIMSFLSAQNTMSAPKRLLDSRKYKNIVAGMLSYVTIKPWAVPFTANGEPVVFAGWNEQISLVSNVARLEKGIPNPKERPMLTTPWELAFEITMMENSDVSVKLLEDIFHRGGVAVGLGTWRGLYGKFSVSDWTVE